MTRNKELTELAIKKGWVIKTKDSEFYIFTSKMTKLIRRLQSIFLDEIATNLGFEEWLFPRMIPEESVKSTGWLDYHPSEAFLINTALDSDYQDKRYLLEPIQCTPLYHALQDKVATFNLPLKVVECLGGWSWRNEKSEKIDGLFKSKAFLRIEFVWIGDRNTVIKIRKSILDLSIQKLNKYYELNLDKAKGDSCFIESPPKVEYTVVGNQVRNNAPTIDVIYKRSNPPEIIEIASGSIHGDKIMNNFNITVESDKKLYSGCFGFGLTRLALIILEKTNFNIK